MKRWALALACTATATLLGGCHLKTGGGGEEDPLFDDIDDPSCDDGGVGGSGASSNTGGYGAGGDATGGDGAGGDAAVPCEDHDDCAEGFICDADLDVCVPGTLACEEIEEEPACVERPDCEPVYAGIDCSCGPDCTCIGGEPGCVCEGFEFFACEAIAE